ncbi:SDR family oxidoreductase [Rhizosaccharibacter radicis]|uniref:SDR family oxidoreductase n=1 Tax=Rhizosaccharibacter radicis TaxID=2782605 RepID=A0ABT1VVW6_9PROT|nr:SDR family oxidoreductase [Acetobacteraceae bacterium KSS12]
MSCTDDRPAGLTPGPALPTAAPPLGRVAGDAARPGNAATAARNVRRLARRQRNAGGVVVIAGASSGIGRCTALLFAAEGWRVGLVGRNPLGLADTGREIAETGVRHLEAVADVTDEAALERAAAAIEAALGPIELWVNVAGNGVYGRFSEVPDAEFRRVTEVTYHGTVNGTRVALRRMLPRDRGTIVNVCSAVVFHGVPLMTSYSGAKAAVRAFAQSLRMELRLGGSKVRIGTVFPPAVNTPFFDRAPSYMGFPGQPVPPVYQPEVVARGIRLCAAGRGGEAVLTGTVWAYALITRISPGLAAFLVSLGGFGRPLPSDPGIERQVEPELFEARATRFSTHGPFNKRARRRSLHTWLTERWHRQA